MPHLLYHITDLQLIILLFLTPFPSPITTPILLYKHLNPLPSPVPYYNHYITFTTPIPSPALYHPKPSFLPYNPNQLTFHEILENIVVEKFPSTPWLQTLYPSPTNGHFFLNYSEIQYNLYRLSFSHTLYKLILNIKMNTKYQVGN